LPGFEPCGSGFCRLFLPRDLIAAGMILTCPECTTRYQADAANFPPSGRDVRCAKCGHVWRQLPPEPEPEAVVVEPEPEAPPAHSFEAVPQAQAYVQAPALDVPLERTPKRPSTWPRRIGLGLGWAGLALIVLSIGMAASLYRQQIVEAWPQTASLYAKLGMSVNAGGLEFGDVKYHMETQDGQAVLEVTGTLTNVTKADMPVPQIRVALSGEDKRELYHWTFAPDVMTLHPGQSTHFATRLTSPPAAARHLDLRFAQAGE